MSSSATPVLVRFASAFAALAIFSLVAVVEAEAEEADPPAEGEATDQVDVEEAPSPSGVVYSPAFLDVGDDSPFVSEIRSMLAAGVTRGCGGEGVHFCPEDRVTRGQMAAFLVRALALEPGDVQFADTEDSVFLSDVGALAVADITTGCNPPANTRFCPDEPISRGQMAAFLARALDLEPGDDSFQDTSAHQFEAEISALAAAGITRGCNPPDNTRFCPDEAITRAQMAAFLLRSETVAQVPAVPPGVSFVRSPLAEDPGRTEVEVCPAGAEVTVLHAADGSVVGQEAERSDVTVSAGSYDQERDVWVVPGDEGCSVLVAEWLVGPPDFEMPIDGYRITSRFGVRIHPILGHRHLHSGVDFAAPTGTSVMAAADGTVIEAGRSGRYGTLVVVAHQNGYTTYYAHLSRLGVGVGDEVLTGDPVGEVGCTGSCTGPHLHFEIRKSGVALDPLDYLPR